MQILGNIPIISSLSSNEDKRGKNFARILKPPTIFWFVQMASLVSTPKLGPHDW